MTVTLTNAQGTFDITGIVSTAALSGEVRQCCRTLDLEVVSSPYDEHVPAVDCAVGSAVSLYEGGRCRLQTGGRGLRTRRELECTGAPTGGEPEHRPKTNVLQKFEVKARCYLRRYYHV